MGVLGLTPFLQKTCPEVIKQLPDRLRGLAGKRVIIDGTLITQRLHFAPSPHPYRHVLGWYRLARELQEAGVKAVCVFDGKERNVAKTREAERRREAQRKVQARGALEIDRTKRLKKLSEVLPKFWNLGDAAQHRVTGLLRQLAPHAEPRTIDTTIPISRQEHVLQRRLVGTLPSPDESPAPPLLAHIDIAVPEYVADEIIENDGHGHLRADSAATFLSDADLTSVEGYSPPDHPWFHDSDIDTPHHAGLGRDFFDLEQHDPEIFIPVSFDPSDEVISEPIPAWAPSFPSPSSILDVPSQLSDLYLEYRQCVSRLAILSDPLNSSLPGSPSVGDADTQADIVMTKAQYQLTLEEGRFWDSFAASQSPEQKVATGYMRDTSMKLPDALEKLSKTSELMSASFERRMNPPTSSTYNESKEILKAMGLPCIESTGAFEAEALASAMVLNGLADYVVSEDTDVLVYEAPLVRNLTNKNTPLTVVSGTDIRTVLQLSRASFVDFALLLGTDFSQRIKNVGPTRALKFIREHKTIERVIEFETKKFPLPLNLEAYLDQVEVARLVFCTLPPVPDESMLEQEDPDEKAVLELLQKYDLGREVMGMPDWDHEAALKGNYFQDNPSAI
ncbi:hypothetical protein H0H87_008581 [Tephrocybe sp. NHM501043]|nr:hypothetical protein H0H87_008581 [Tephrocybe sp. NHM501043]